ncbi:uncharacterized protein LOC26515012, partial [Drosophila ananassae]|uniref:uncharacterized protein LOC26515012 n=1 Tax=Drosophila ananassae TaxID=7217 RepID=UPI0013A5D0CF
IVQTNLENHNRIYFKAYSKFEFTNLNCETLNKSYADFEYCYLKSINRTYKYLSIKVNLLKKPIRKVKVRAALFKRFNGWRPFMFDMTVDACNFLKNTKSNLAAKYFLDFFKPFSNMNHSCPFDHDLIVDKMNIAHINHQFTNVLPFPEGDYFLETHWIAYDIDRAVVKMYGTLS